MKRLGTVTVLVFTLGVALTGCGSSSQPASKTPEPSLSIPTDQPVDFCQKVSSSDMSGWLGTAASVQKATVSGKGTSCTATGTGKVTVLWTATPSAATVAATVKTLAAPGLQRLGLSLPDGSSAVRLEGSPGGVATAYLVGHLKDGRALTVEATGGSSPDKLGDLATNIAVAYLA